MRSALFVAVSGIVLSVAGLAQSTGPGAMVGNLQVKEVGIADIDSSHLKMTINLTLVPEQSATLKDIQLCAPYVSNGLPGLRGPIAPGGFVAQRRSHFSASGLSYGAVS